MGLGLPPPLREGALGQSYVEPHVLEPGALAERFLPFLVEAVTEPLPQPL